MNTHLFNCADESQTIALAKTLAFAANPGDLITLKGDLGAGKTSFARAFIRAYLNQPDHEVPSPTYTLAIEHSAKSGKHITHLDLYRISDPHEIDELGIEDALEQGPVLIEWPQQAENALPPHQLQLTIEIIDSNQRKIWLDGPQDLLTPYLRSIEIKHFLKSNWPVAITRTPFPADASARKYEWVESKTEKRILMDAPKMPDGPVIQNGLPYSRIAHLAEEVRPFVAIGTILRDNNFCAPEIFAADCDKGLLLLEYLGSDTIIDAERNPIAQRYLDAGRLLALLHDCQWPAIVPMKDNTPHQIPTYDPPSMLIEAQLLTQWYLRDERFDHISEDDLIEYDAIWKNYTQTAQTFRQSIVLRDYHSPNIIWREANDLRQRIGLIDFQDAMIGPAAYDVASLAQDARVKVSPELEAEIVEQYCTHSKSLDNNFDRAAFEQEYAVMGALRTSKVLGFCIRVDLRDGKPQYRALIPQMRQYLKRNLAHRALEQYRKWCKRVIDL